MKLSWSAVATVFAAMSSVNAHFQVTFPEVRGPFNADNETQFCGGYTQPANRTQFPLTNGFILWEASNSSWTIGVMLSTAPSPTSLNDFRTTSGADQFVVGYFQGNGSTGCISVMPTAAGIPGVQNGTNVTLQMVFDGGDGPLFQCMDVTLDDQFSIPSDVGQCTNPQGQPPSNRTSSLSPTLNTNLSPASSSSLSSTRSLNPSSISSSNPSLTPSSGFLPRSSSNPSLTPSSATPSSDLASTPSSNHSPGSSSSLPLTSSSSPSLTPSSSLSSKSSSSLSQASSTSAGSSSVSSGSSVSPLVSSSSSTSTENNTPSPSSPTAGKSSNGAVSGVPNTLPWLGLVGVFVCGVLA